MNFDLTIFPPPTIPRSFLHPYTPKSILCFIQNKQTGKQCHQSKKYKKIKTKSSFTHTHTKRNGFSPFCVGQLLQSIGSALDCG